jgi:hypothetical protein
MKSRFLLVGCSVLALSLAGGEIDASDTVDHGPPVVASQQPPAATDGFRSQPGKSPTLELAPQGGVSKTLELAPQPGLSVATPRLSNISEQRQFNPSDAVDAEKRDFRPRTDEPFSPPFWALSWNTRPNAIVAWRNTGLR